MARKGEALCVVDEIPAVNTSTSIMPTVDKVLAGVGLRPDRLQRIACVVGPGSFTGIRIGVSVANAMSLAGPARLPLNALEVLRLGRSEDVVAAIPSRKGFDYTTVGELSLEEVGALRSVGVEGSGAATIISRQGYIDLLDAAVLDGYDHVSDDFFQPVYLKKSQAERQLESKQ